MKPVVAFAAGMAAAFTLVGVVAAREPRPIQASSSNVTPKQQRADSIRFVNHSQHIQPGLVGPRDTIGLANPFEGNAAAIAAGAKIYIAYNCMDCHGADGSGAMAPAFVDSRWHFGGSAGQVYESIAQGRPDGMPAWGGFTDQQTIWRLVAYVRSLEKGKDVATENFTGKTVERSGH